MKNTNVLILEKNTHQTEDGVLPGKDPQTITTTIV